MQSFATLFSPKQSTNRQLVDEIKCYFLHDQLLKIKSAFADKYGTEVPNRFSQFLKQFERALIINSRTEAVQTGEAYLTAGCKALCRVLKPHRTTPVLNELGIEDSEQDIPFESHYISTQHYLERLVTSPYQPEEQETYSEIIISLAKCKAFSLLKDLLDKLPKDVCNSLQAALDTAFFYSVHFGDHETMQYLLHRGVSPHVINQHDADRKQMPLMLLLADLYRCVLRMQKRVQDSQTGKLINGSLADIERVFDARLYAYSIMIIALLEHGADPNQIPDDSFNHKTSPSETAQSYIEQLIPELSQSGFHFKSKAAELTALLHLIAKPQIAAAAVADAEPTNKRAKI